MGVTVHLHTVLQRQTPEGLVRQLNLDIPLDSTVENLLNDLEIDFPLESLLLVVNGRLVEPGGAGVHAPAQHCVDAQPAGAGSGV